MYVRVLRVASAVAVTIGLVGCAHKIDSQAKAADEIKSTLPTATHIRCHGPGGGQPWRCTVIFEGRPNICAVAGKEVPEGTVSCFPSDGPPTP